jgi:hypothetical protein
MAPWNFELGVLALVLMLWTFPEFDVGLPSECFIHSS